MKILSSIKTDVGEVRKICVTKFTIIKTPKCKNRAILQIKQIYIQHLIKFINQNNSVFLKQDKTSKELKYQMLSVKWKSKKNEINKNYEDRKVNCVCEGKLKMLRTKRKIII